MPIVNADMPLTGFRRLLPQSARNWIADRLLKWSGSFAEAALWIAPEMRPFISDDEFGRALTNRDDFSDIPF